MLRTLYSPSGVFVVVDLTVLTVPTISVSCSVSVLSFIVSRSMLLSRYQISLTTKHQPPPVLSFSLLSLHPASLESVSLPHLCLQVSRSRSGIDVSHGEIVGSGGTIASSIFFKRHFQLFTIAASDLKIVLKIIMTYTACLLLGELFIDYFTILVSLLKSIEW